MPDYAATGPIFAIGPRFTEGLKSVFSTQNPEPTLVFFSNPDEGPGVVDMSSSAITVIIKGREVPRTIIDGGFGINVISQLTCDTLGIKEWEPCPFCLRMVDTSSVRPTRLIRNLDITIEGHAFRISAEVLQLNMPEHIPYYWQDRG